VALSRADGLTGQLLQLHLAPINRNAETKMANPFKPVKMAPCSGQYEIVGPRGGGTGVERTVTGSEPLPPTPEKGQAYTLVDATKHKTGK
jgi:hypothetical protein